MKNKHEIFGLAANILAVVLLLAFIVAGLNFIGIYKLPAPIEKLLGTYEDSDGLYVGNDNEVYDIIGFSDDDAQYHTVDLDYSNAKAILEELSVNADYVHDVTVRHCYENAERVQIVSVKRNSGLYEASVFEDNARVKSIKESKDTVVITTPEGEEEVQISLPKGSFDISRECGFILNVSEFLESDVELDESTFSQFSNDYGVFLTILFESSLNDIVYKQSYVISLDFGVVTEVKCYEQDKLVYEMITDSLGLGH